VSPACPANCLPLSGSERLERASLQQPGLGPRDAPAVVVASSRGKQPHCPVGKHKQAHGVLLPRACRPPPSPRQDLASACLGLSSTLCKISILPLVLGLFLRTCFPFLRRWRRTWPSGPDPGSSSVATDLPVRIVGRLNGAPAATLEPEMSSISSRDQCLSMMSKRTFCASAGSESRLFGLYLPWAGSCPPFGQHRP